MKLELTDGPVSSSKPLASLEVLGGQASHFKPLVHSRKLVDQSLLLTFLQIDTKFFGVSNHFRAFHLYLPNAVIKACNLNSKIIRLPV